MLFLQFDNLKANSALCHRPKAGEIGKQSGGVVTHDGKFKPCEENVKNMI